MKIYQASWLFWFFLLQSLVLVNITWAFYVCTYFLVNLSLIFCIATTSRHFLIKSMLHGMHILCVIMYEHWMTLLHWTLNHFQKGTLLHSIFWGKNQLNLQQQPPSTSKFHGLQQRAIAEGCKVSNKVNN